MFKDFNIRVLFIKLMLVLPFIWFVSYMLMIAFGLTGELFNAPGSFFCGVYCKVGLGLIIISSVVGAFLCLKNCKK